MPERIDWLDDNTPYSPRFGDRYRSELGGLAQAREVFLAGCGLPSAWRNQLQWCVLETGFGLGLNFLVTWQAWKADANRPQMLHFLSTEAFPASAADVLRSAQAHACLLPLAEELQAQLCGLLPGFHRLVFEQGRVLLTLCIGDAKNMLRQQQFIADSVYLDGFSPQKNPDIWDTHTLKAVARCCRRGTRIATWTVARKVRDALAEVGFVVQKTPGVAPKRNNLQGQYQPAWESRGHGKPPLIRTRDSCVVVGAGLAGAAVAASLARRGWHVLVLDEADTLAAGASGLPAGLVMPHVSSDDSLLSQLSRIGVRMTLQQAQQFLQQGQDWQLSGVLQHVLQGVNKQLPRTLTQAWPEAALHWSRIANDQERINNALPISSQGFWHSQAAWIKPASLVKAWLAQPGIRWCANTKAVRLSAGGRGWQVIGVNEETLADASLVVLAAGYGSRALATHLMKKPLALQAIRGQLSWTAASPRLTQSPVNGQGSFIPAVPLDGEMVSIFGAGFERDCDRIELQSQDHADNLTRLAQLLPGISLPYSTQDLRGWAGIRCATPTRFPLVTPIAITDHQAQVWLCTGMGSRGLTFAHLCAEWMAARLHGEPLPLELRWAKTLAV